jgi:hypothetical protein
MFCEQYQTLTHHSFIQKIDVCQSCAEALAWAENFLRSEGGLTRPLDNSPKEPWDIRKDDRPPFDPSAGEEWKDGDGPDHPDVEGGFTS